MGDMNVASLLVLLLNLSMFLLIARAILSWFPIGFDSPVRPVADVVERLTDPIILPVRRVMPTMGPLDLSTLVVIFAIRLLLIPLARSLPF